MKLTPLLIAGVSFFVLQSCQPKADEPASGGGTTGDYCTANGFSVGTELSICATNSAYSPAVSVTGTAKFYKRDIELAGATPASGLRLGAQIGTPLPIRFAEVRVLDSGGNVVQCGKTDGSGNIKALNGTSTLAIPSSAGTYTIEVLARANHNMDVSANPGKSTFQLLTSVKSPCSETVHKISGGINSTGSGTYNLDITASANENVVSTIPGGAFNIYNNVVSTYEYLAENTGTSNLSCLSPKLHVYWVGGFNPGQLIDPNSDPADVSNISFYLRSYNELYINGGKLGNVSSEDTDQFDDAVIIHEIGHRIEDVCGRMDSPGGSHFGLFRIDPRLAWSEGWGNYFGAHIIRNKTAVINPNLSTTLSAFDDWKFYLDTTGYHDGASTAGDDLIRLDLTTHASVAEANGSYFYDRIVSATATPGEGHFREVSIARSLFKSSNTCTASTCIDQNYFPQMWKAFERDSGGVGMGKSTYPFRSSVRFWNRLNDVFVNVLSLPFPATIDSVLNTDEAQQRDGYSGYVDGSSFTTWVPYGIKLAASGVTSPAPPPCTLKLQPRNETDTVTYGLHDQRYSSHFYYFDRTTLPSVTNITLTASKVAGTSVDIDLLLFADGYRNPGDTCLNPEANCTLWSKNTSSTEFVRADQTNIADGTQGGTFTKSISTLNTLSSSTAYLLNIRAFTSEEIVSANTEYSYTLTTQTGEYLCPAANF